VKRVPAPSKTATGLSADERRVLALLTERLADEAAPRAA
jgi:hypothetical protein